jgi:hypothetical protein
VCRLAIIIATTLIAGNALAIPFAYIAAQILADVTADFV